MKQEFPKFEHIDHTADVGFKAYGKTLADLFANAAEGLFDIITNPEKVKTDLQRSIEVSADDREELLVKWLSELNYLFFTERELYSRFEIESVDDSKVSARVFGEKLDHDRHEIYTEVKAVTYHYLYIKQTDRGWEAQVILDL